MLARSWPTKAPAVSRLAVRAADRFLDYFQDVQSSLGWSEILGNGLMPVEPVKNVALSVKSGSLPSDLSGAYMRIGPNVHFWPPRKRTHVFDGDGMLHVVRLVGGVATYHCDYMRTPRFELEKKLGREWFTRIGEFSGYAGLAKIMTTMPKKGKAYGLEQWECSVPNTAVVLTPQGHLWATNEGGAPFRFRLAESGEPQSLGYDTQLGSHKAPMSAHPKFDLQTGEIFFHGKVPGKSPRFFMARAQGGRVLECTDIPEVRRGFHHDIFITEKYVGIIDGSMLFQPKNIVSSGPLWNFDPTVNLRFGICSRSEELTADNFTWIEAPVPADIAHVLTAFDEEPGKITLWCPLFEQGDDQETVLGDMGPLRMHRVDIDMNTRSVGIHKVSGTDDFDTEFPRFRDDRGCQRVRFGYSGWTRPGPDFNFTGILKWDLEDTSLPPSLIRFPDGVIGGEPVFFPRQSSTAESDSRGEDGYVGGFQWNTATKESTLAVYDAQTMSATPVVELAVPCRVPLGFHAGFITEEQFQRQLGA